MDQDYMSFVETVRQKIVEALSCSEDAVYYTKGEEETDGAGERLIIRRELGKDMGGICSLHIRDLYIQNKTKSDVDEIVSHILEEISVMTDSGCFQNAQRLQRYEDIKDFLFVRMLNVEQNRDALNDAVYRTMGDIALVLYANLGEFHDCVTSVKIKEYMIRQWEKNVDPVFEAAIHNTYQMSPPRIYFWERMLVDSNYNGEDFMNSIADDVIGEQELITCLSTTKRTNGAVAIVLPGVASRIGELIGNDYFLVFTSVHEVMIHDVSSVKSGDLEKVLRDTIRDTTPPEDFLTYRIYRYDRERDEITFA